MKVDLVMWAKNGAKFLPTVLKRFDEVIPKEEINKKILVDDHSCDKTVDIAKRFNWKVYENPSTGISSGANEALRHVTTSRFVSFEQDILLSKSWWYKIPNCLENPRVVSASGVRYSTKPVGIKKLEKYYVQRFRKIQKTKHRFEHRYIRSPCQTVDNTIYRTDFIKSIGGFPRLSGTRGFDVILAHLIWKSGFEWVVDCTVESEHLRLGLKQVLHHAEENARNSHEVWTKITKETGLQRPHSDFYRFLRLFLSPLEGLVIAIKMREPTIFYVNPIKYMYQIRGFINSAHVSSFKRRQTCLRNEDYKREKLSRAL